MNITRFLNIAPVLRHGKISAVQCSGMKACCNFGALRLLQNNDTKQQTRFVSAYEVKSNQKDNFVKKILKKIPLLTINKSKIRASAYLLYEGIADTVNYLEFFDKFNLPDTFYSWFVVTELHIWMLSVRAMAEGEEGRILRNSLVEALWTDVAQRVKKLGAANPAAARAQVNELSEQLQAALIAYDEGLQSSDIILAGAIWRRFYQFEAVDLQNLEELVKYIRKQITLLDNVSKGQLFEDISIRWEPLSS